MKGGFRLSRVSVVALVAAAIATGVAPALAEQAKFPTRLNLKLNRSTEGDTISGKVRSDAHQCEADRKVRLFHRAVSEKQKASQVAKLRTNGKGKWTFRPNQNQNGDRYATPGDYHVKAGQKKVSTGSGPITCKRKNSSSIFVG